MDRALSRQHPVSPCFRQRLGVGYFPRATTVARGTIDQRFRASAVSRSATRLSVRVKASTDKRRTGRRGVLGCGRGLPRACHSGDDSSATFAPRPPRTAPVTRRSAKRRMMFTHAEGSPSAYYVGAFVGPDEFRGTGPGFYGCETPRGRPIRARRAPVL
jgi:hypothetical protein